MRLNWWADVLMPLLLGLSEGCWLAVLYLLFETLGNVGSPLGLAIFVATAWAGLLVARPFERLGERRWLAMMVIVVGLAGIGMAAAPGVLGAVIARDPGRALELHPGGWLLGIAALRGLLGGGALGDPAVAGRPFVRGVIGLALVWLYAGLLPAPSQAEFRSVALGPTLFFAVSGLAAAGLRRVHAVSAAAGIQWWRNRAWLLALAVGLAGVAATASLVANAVVGIVPAVLGLAGFPELVILVVIAAFLLVGGEGPREPRRSNYAGLVALVVLLVIAAIAYHFFHPPATTPATAPGTALATKVDDVNGLFGVVILAIFAVLVVLGLVYVARGWRRSVIPAPMDRTRDSSSFDIEGPGTAWLGRLRNRLRRDRGGGRPASAEGAYLAALSLFERSYGLRRRSNETPAGHARRLHGEGNAGLELDLLAADYELSRWGGRQLPARETGRAIGRWERIRARMLEREAAERAALEPADDRRDPG